MDPSRRAVVLGATMLPFVCGASAMIGPQDLGVVEESVVAAAAAYDSEPCERSALAGGMLAQLAARGITSVRSGTAPWRHWHRAHARALVIRAHAQCHQGLPRDAQATLMTAHASAVRSGDGPTEAHVWALRGRIADHSGRHYDAVRMAIHGRRLAPSSPLALLLAVKTEAGAWSALGRVDRVEQAVGHAMAIQRRLGEQWDAPRGFSLLDDGLHPADVALSAAGALAAVRLPADELVAVAAYGADEHDALAMRSAVRTVGARAALARGAHDEAAGLLCEAYRISASRPADWLAREIAAVGGVCRTRDNDLAEVMSAAEAWTP